PPPASRPRIPKRRTRGLRESSRPGTGAAAIASERPCEPRPLHRHVEIDLVFPDHPGANRAAALPDPFDGVVDFRVGGRDDGDRVADGWRAPLLTTCGISGEPFQKGPDRS